jgi:signal transduction histidine kinase
MSEDVREKIFEPYFTTRDFGSGIGLTLVYKVVKEHMGEISVRSEEGEGTRFILTFPVPQREQHLLGWSGEDTV